MRETVKTELVGEIVEVSTTSFVAQRIPESPEKLGVILDPPPFGSFVKIVAEPPPGQEFDRFEARPTTYALVCHARTSSLAPGRRPMALGCASEEEIRQTQPQIFELLTTEFSGLLIAYRQADNRIRRHLPPVPPRIHHRVYSCLPSEIIDITANLSFLRAILAPGANLEGAPGPEALTAACLRNAWEAQNESQDFLELAGRKLLDLLGDDYERLREIMNSVLD